MFGISFMSALAAVLAKVFAGPNVFVGNKVMIGDHCKIQNNVSVYDNVHFGGRGILWPQYGFHERV